MDWITVALCAALVAQAIVIWLMVCNERTCQARLAMIKTAASLEELDQIDRVTHNQHLWALFWGRDPQTLYNNRA